MDLEPSIKGVFRFLIVLFSLSANWIVLAQNSTNSSTIVKGQTTISNRTSSANVSTTSIRLTSTRRTPVPRNISNIGNNSTTAVTPVLLNITNSTGNITTKALKLNSTTSTPPFRNATTASSITKNGTLPLLSAMLPQQNQTNTTAFTNGTTTVPTDSNNGGDGNVLTNQVMRQYFVAILILVIFCFVFICVVLITLIIIQWFNNRPANSYIAAGNGDGQSSLRGQPSLRSQSSGIPPRPSRPIVRKDDATNTSFPQTASNSPPPVTPHTPVRVSSRPSTSQANLEPAAYPPSPPLPPPPTAVRQEFPLVSMGDDISQHDIDAEVEVSSISTSELSHQRRSREPSEEYLSAPNSHEESPHRSETVRA